MLYPLSLFRSLLLSCAGVFELYSFSFVLSLFCGVSVCRRCCLCCLSHCCSCHCRCCMFVSYFCLCVSAPFIFFSDAHYVGSCITSLSGAAHSLCFVLSVYSSCSVSLLCLLPFRWDSYLRGTLDCLRSVSQRCRTTNFVCVFFFAVVGSWRLALSHSRGSRDHSSASKLFSWGVFHVVERKQQRGKGLYRVRRRTALTHTTLRPSSCSFSIVPLR